MTEKLRPFHENIRCAIEQVLWFERPRLRSEGVAVLETLFGILRQSEMPVEAARKLADTFRNIPEDLRRFGGDEAAARIEAAIENLKGRGEPKKPAAATQA